MVREATLEATDEAWSRFERIINLLLHTKSVRIDTAYFVDGHRPIIWFNGDENEGLRVYRIAVECGFEIMAVRKAWYCYDLGLDEPIWELEFRSLPD